MTSYYGIAALVLAASLSGCNALPRDPAATSDRLRAGEPVRAGLVAGGGGVGPARRVVERAARRLGTTVRWRVDAGEPLLHALETGKLDVVVGRFATQSPWMKHVALSDPVGTAEPDDSSEPALRLARANGENAWIALLDEEIAK